MQGTNTIVVHVGRHFERFEKALFSIVQGAAVEEYTKHNHYFLFDSAVATDTVCRVIVSIDAKSRHNWILFIIVQLWGLQLQYNSVYWLFGAAGSYSANKRGSGVMSFTNQIAPILPVHT